MKSPRRITSLLIAPLLTVTAALVLGADTPPDRLPPVFAGLVPSGYRLVSPGFTRRVTGEGDMTVTTVGVTFVASKPYKGRHFLADSEVHFDLAVMGYPEILVRSQGKYYVMQRDKDIESARQAYRDHESDAVTGYDTPKETQYSWGWGITQRRLHHYMGAGTAPDDIDYLGEYRGLIVGDTTIKKFAFLVVGAGSAEEADRWAGLCADTIEKTPVAEIR